VVTKLWAGFKTGACQIRRDGVADTYSNFAFGNRLFWSFNMAPTQTNACGVVDVVWSHNIADFGQYYVIMLSSSMTYLKADLKVIKKQ
jgi:hypothetical protein